MLLQLGQRASHLDAGWPAADDDHRHQPRADSGVPLDRCALEVPDDTAADGVRVCQILQTDRVAFHRSHAEVVRHRPRRDHEVVVWYAAHIRDHAAGVEIDACHLGEQEAYVARAAEDGPHRLCDVICCQTGGCDLVQQRHERVMVVPVDDEHIDGRVGEPARHAQAAEPGADHHHAAAARLIQPRQ